MSMLGAYVAIIFKSIFFVVHVPGSETTVPSVIPETCKEKFLYAKCCPEYDDDIIADVEGECEGCSCGDGDPEPGLTFLLQNLTTIL